MWQGPSLVAGLCCPWPSLVPRPHPPPFRPGATSRLNGYTHRLLPVRKHPGPGRASPVPAPTLWPSRSPYPGGFLGACTSRSWAPSMAFAVIPAARHPLVPFRANLTGLQDPRHAAGWPVAPPNGAFDAALRRRAFPPDAGSLLLGLLAATQTGLPPAGEHGLTRGSLLPSTSSRYVVPHAAGHKESRLVLVSLQGRRAGVKIGSGCPPTPALLWDVSPWVSLAPGP